MSRKHNIQSGLLCLLISLFMIVMGMRAEEYHADSLFEYPAFGAVSFQKISGEQETVIYRDNSVLSQLENLTAVRSSGRSSAGMRTVYCPAVCLAVTPLLLKLLLQQKSFFLHAACDNQYRRRTLKYIHHTDGKKA